MCLCESSLSCGHVENFNCQILSHHRITPINTNHIHQFLVEQLTKLRRCSSNSQLLLERCQPNDLTIAIYA